MKTCEKCKKLKSNGGRCPGLVHHCVVGNYDLFEPMEKEVEFYICDHGKKCGIEYCRFVHPQVKQFNTCHYNINATCIPYTEEKEPKTKRVAVIWFGDVSEDTVKCQLYFDNKHDELTQNPEQDVELIDIERLRYGIPDMDDKDVLCLTGGLRKDIIRAPMVNHGKVRLLIDPPTPEPEPEFMECPECREKLGTPILCRACLNNRNLIEHLRKERSES